MGMPVPNTTWTVDMLDAIPDDGQRYELIDGELFVTPAPATRHQQIVTELTILLGGFVKEHALGRVLAGPIDVLFAEGDYVEPDLVFVARGHEALLTDRGIEGPPDLVVQVLSPATEARDRGLRGPGHGGCVEARCPGARGGERRSRVAGRGKAPRDLARGRVQELRGRHVRAFSRPEVPPTLGSAIHKVRERFGLRHMVFGRGAGGVGHPLAVRAEPTHAPYVDF
jgi:hypothetical protein